MNIHGINSVGTLNQAAGGFATLSGSFTGSFKGDGSQLTNLPSVAVNTGSLVTTASFNAYTQSTDNRLNNLESTTSSLNTSISNLNSFTASNGIASLNAFTQSQAALNLTFATTGSNTFRGIETISGAIVISASSADAITLNNGNIYAPTSTISADVFTGNFVNLYNQYAGVGLALNAANSGSQFPAFNANVDSTVWPKDIFGGLQIQDPSLNYFTYAGLAANSYSPEYFGEVVAWFGGGANNANGSNTAFIMRTGSANLEIFKPIVANFNLNVLGSLTASLQQGYTWVGNASNVSTLVSTSSFGGGGSVPAGTISSSAQITALGFVSSSITASSIVTASVNLNTITFTKGDASTFALTVNTGSGGGGGGVSFPYTGSAVITGSLAITGSFRGFTNTLTVASSTASINMNDGNFFRLTLPTGSTTHVTVSNLASGQTINLLVSQSLSATGSIAFAPNIKFAGGVDYTATAITGAMDIVSFVSFDTNQIFATQVKNLS